MEPWRVYYFVIFENNDANWELKEHKFKEKKEVEGGKKKKVSKIIYI